MNGAFQKSTLVEKSENKRENLEGIGLESPEVFHGDSDLKGPKPYKKQSDSPHKSRSVPVSQ